MEKSEMMKKYEEKTGKQAIYWTAFGPEISQEYLDVIESKAEAYDRLMSGKATMTLKEMANFKGRPITVDADGAINAHGAEPHLSRGGFAGYTDCWANGADDYEEIPESFVEIPDGFDWTTSLTLPDGWEEK